MFCILYVFAYLIHFFTTLQLIFMILIRKMEIDVENAEVYTAYLADEKNRDLPSMKMLGTKVWDDSGVSKTWLW